MQLTKKTTTVKQALAPFEKVKANLKAVLAHQDSVRTASGKRTEAADKRVEQAIKAQEATKKAEGPIIDAANAETAQAEALIEKLNALLGTDTPSAEKANT